MSGDALSLPRRITCQGSSSLKARVSKYSGQLAKPGPEGEQLPSEKRHRPTLKTTAAEPSSGTSLREPQKVPQRKSQPYLSQRIPQQMENEPTHQTEFSSLSFLPQAHPGGSKTAKLDGEKRKIKGWEGGNIWFLLQAISPQCQVGRWRGRLIPVWDWTP